MTPHRAPHRPQTTPWPGTWPVSPGAMTAIVYLLLVRLIYVYEQCTLRMGTPTFWEMRGGTGFSLAGIIDVSSVLLIGYLVVEYVGFGRAAKRHLRAARLSSIFAVFCVGTLLVMSGWRAQVPAIMGASDDRYITVHVPRVAYYTIALDDHDVTPVRSRVNADVRRAGGTYYAAALCHPYYTVPLLPFSLRLNGYDVVLESPTSVTIAGHDYATPNGGSEIRVFASAVFIDGEHRGWVERRGDDSP